MCLCGLVLVLLTVGSPGGRAQTEGATVQKTYLSDRTDFSGDMAGWNRQGEADFSLDTAVRYGDRPTARIRIVAGGTLAYQQIRRDFSDDVKPGDEFRGSVWVRSDGVDQSPGAYMAVEFVAADGSRAGIAHSRSSIDNGARGWEQLVASGTAPDGTRTVRLSLILHAHGTAWFCAPSLTRTARQEDWPDLGARVRKVTVQTDKAVQPAFGGVGFHAFHHIFNYTRDDIDNVIYKRWREMNPSFVRLNDNWDYDRPMLEQIAGHMRRMQETGTEIYLTSWNPPDVRAREDMAAWAARVADNIEFYVRKKGLTNVRNYCMSNELSLNGWGKMAGDLPRFREYHRALAEELRSRKLDVGLLATDASPVDYWHTLQWAADNMDDVTSIYGAHHYFNERGPEDERFYPWFAGKLEWAVGIARAKGKQFILGEFGAKQDGRTVDGILQDRCVYFETPTEPMVTLQLADAAIAAINAGVYAMGYWTFMDIVDEMSPGYRNKWGTFRFGGADRSTRAIHYGYALLTRYFRGPAAAYRTATDDPRLRAAVVRHTGRGTWSIAVVNRNKRAVALQMAIPGAAGRLRLRKYVYDPTKVRHHQFGDLPGPAGVVTMDAGALKDSVGPMSLTVYTSAFDDQAPPRVSGVHVEQSSGGVRVSWKSSTAKDLCYYRIYRILGGRSEQIGSTIATAFADPAGRPDTRYRVSAVDQSGNEGP